MLTTQELIDMPVGTPVYLVVFEPGEHDWIPSSRKMVPLEKNIIVRTGRLRKGQARNGVFIFGFEIDVHWDQTGWCDRDSTAIACFRDETHFNAWEYDIEQKSQAFCDALLGSIESTFEDILGEKVEIRFE
jgi:hypothetical protein